MNFAIGPLLEDFLDQLDPADLAVHGHCVEHVDDAALDVAAQLDRIKMLANTHLSRPKKSPPMKARGKSEETTHAGA